MKIVTVSRAGLHSKSTLFRRPMVACNCLKHLLNSLAIGLPHTKSSTCKGLSQRIRTLHTCVPFSKNLRLPLLPYIGQDTLHSFIMLYYIACVTGKLSSGNPVICYPHSNDLYALSPVGVFSILKRSTKTLWTRDRIEFTVSTSSWCLNQWSSTETPTTAVIRDGLTHKFSPGTPHFRHPSLSLFMMWPEFEISTQGSTIRKIPTNANSIHRSVARSYYLGEEQFLSPESNLNHFIIFQSTLSS